MRFTAVHSNCNGLVKKSTECSLEILLVSTGYPKGLNLPLPCHHPVEDFRCCRPGCCHSTQCLLVVEAIPETSLLLLALSTVCSRALADHRARSTHGAARVPFHWPRSRGGQHSRSLSVGTEPTLPGPTERPVSGAHAGEREREGPCASGPSTLAPSFQLQPPRVPLQHLPPLEGQRGQVPRDGTVTSSEASETTLLLSRECAPPPPPRRARQCSLRGAACRPER